MRVTIVLPISRADYLKKVFDCLELQDTRDHDINLLTVVDGHRIYEQARNLTQQTRFNQRLCVEYKDQDRMKPFNIAHRRKRIAKIHNFAKDKIQDCDYVFLVEDDTTFKPDTLKKLLQNYADLPYAGLIQGVEVGRHGINHYGVWNFDDIYEPTQIKSSDKQAGLKECDAGGLYCALIRRDNYIKHEFKPFEGNGLGPDVDFGISLRRQGLKNYTNWGITCNHHVNSGVIDTTNARTVTFARKDKRWRQIKSK